MKQFFNYALLIIVLSLFAVGWHYYNRLTKPNDALTCNLEGKVVRVTDGDSITVLDQENIRHKIRLAGIDAPERLQPYGKVARQYLAKHVFKKQVCVSWHKRDKYQRLVGIVQINGEDINLKLISAGLGWHYKHYQSEQSALDRASYSNAQDKAQSASVGLWRDRSPIPPWLWRRGER